MNIRKISIASIQQTRFIKHSILRYTVQLTEVRKGHFVLFKGKVCQISDPPKVIVGGRRVTHTNLELKDLIGGNRYSERFNAGATLEGVELEEKIYTFLYSTPTSIVLLDPKTFQEKPFPLTILNLAQKTLALLKEDMEISVKSYEDKPVLFSLPTNAIYKILVAAGKSGGADSGKGTLYKVCEIENGIQIEVPDFLKVGDEIVVDLTTGKYISRHK